MKQDLRRITMLSVASIGALSLFATPLTIEPTTLDIGMLSAHAKDKGGRHGGAVGGAVGDGVDAAADAAGDAGDAVGSAAEGASDGVGDAGDAVDSAADGVSDAADNAGDAVDSAADGVSDAADNAGDAVDSAADGAADPADDAGDAVDSAADGVANAADNAGDAVDSATDGVADAADDAGDAVDSAADGVADATDNAGDAVDSATNDAGDDADDAGEAIDSATTGVADAAETTGDAVEADEGADAEDPTSTATDVGTATDTAVEVEGIRRSAGTSAGAAKATARVTVSVIAVKRPQTGGNGDEKRRAVASRGRSTTAGPASDPPADDIAALDLDAVAPRAGLVPPRSAGSAPQGCATADGRGQGSEISCHIVGSRAKLSGRQIAYAPPDAKIAHSAAAGVAAGAAANAGASAPAISERTGPSIAKLDPSRPVYDEIYGLQQVEARRYADGDVPVLIVQGVVSNMSLGQRPVPPLVAIVQDKRGRELMRWSFRAEAESLGPGAATGFRSEMFDPQSESAKVTIVFASDPETAMQ